MANQRVETSKIVPNNIFAKFKKEARQILNLLDELNEGLKSTAKSFKKVAESTEDTKSESVNDLMDAYEGVNNAQQESIKINKTRNKLLSEEEKLQAKILKARSEEGKRLQELREELKEVNKQNRINIQIKQEEGDAYRELVRNTNEAQANLKKLSAQYGINSKEAKKARKEFEKFDDELRDVNDAAKDGRRDVGRYSAAIRDAEVNLGGFSSELEGVKEAIKDAGNVARKSPLLLIGTAIAGLGAAFKTTNEGAKEFEVIQAQIGATFSETVARIGAFAKSLRGLSLKDLLLGDINIVDLFEEAFDGYSDALSKNTEAAKTAAEANFDLQREILQVNETIAEQEKQQALLEQRAGDSTIALREQAKANVAAQKVAVSVTKQKRDQLQAELDILQAQKEAAGTDSARFLVQQQISAKRLELIALEQEFEVANAQLRTDLRQVEQDEAELRLDFLFDVSDRLKTINERILADERVTIEQRQALLGELRESLTSTYSDINKELKAFAGEDFDLFELTKLSAQEQAQFLQQLESSEIITTRVKEGVVEYIQVIQDLTDAQKDLNENKIEILDERDVVNAQTKALEALKKENANFEKIQEELEDDILQAQIDSLTKQVNAREKAGQETVEQQKELNELLLEQQQILFDKEEKARLKKEAEDKKLAEEQAKIIDAIYSSIAESISGSLDKELDKIDKRINKIEERRSQLEEAAAQGSKDAIESLVIEAKEQEKAELQAEKRRKQQIQIEAGLAAIRIAGQKAAEGKPISDALKDVGTIQAITGAIIAGVPAFFEGTEDTGTVSGALDSNGGRVAILHDNERVMTKEQNKSLGGISNSDLANIGSMYNKGKLINVSEMNQARPILALEKPSFDMGMQFQELIKEVKNMPTKMPKNSLHYDQQKKAMNEIVDTRFKRHIKTHDLKGGVFS